MLNLKPGQKVLDVGCGIGGGDFYMAKVRAARGVIIMIWEEVKGAQWQNNDVTFQTFGVEVLGLDLSDNVVNIAMERAISEKLPAVRLDVTSPN